MESIVANGPLEKMIFKKEKCASTGNMTKGEGGNFIGDGSEAFLGTNIERGLINNIDFSRNTVLLELSEDVYDISAEGNGSIVMIKEIIDDYTINLKIMSKDKIYAPTNSSKLFSYLTYLKKINFENFDTSKVTDMSSMFASAGSFSQNLVIDVSRFDTGNVINMSSMFENAGGNAENFMINVKNFDTSKVTNMSSMFASAACNNADFILEVENFNTSRVTDMSFMFNYVGKNSTKLELNVSNFDTSNVTDMSFMFYEAGYSNPNFNLNISNFKTNKLNFVSNMLCRTGYSNSSFNVNKTIFNIPQIVDYNQIGC